MNELATVLPSDITCEKSVLNIALSYNGYWDKLSSELFYNAEYRSIFETAKAIEADGGRADICTVINYSNKHNLGINPLTLTDITILTPVTGAFTENITILTELAMKRKLYVVGSQLIASISNKSVTFTDLMDRVKTQITGIEASVTHANVENYVVDLSREYPKPQYTLEFNGTGFMPRGNIHAVVAKKKSGKSHLCAVFMASMFGCVDFGIKSLCPDAKILYVDTEQDISDVAALSHKVLTLCGWDAAIAKGRFLPLFLRDRLVNERLPIIVKEARKFKPTAVFIDGIVDLCADFNDNKDSHLLVQALMRLSTECDCAVVCVLHKNESKDNDKARGHLGTMLEQKACDGFSVEYSGCTFNVKHSVHRHKAIGDFAFGLDGHGVPMRADSITEVKAEADTEALSRLIRQAFGQTREMTYTELYKAVALYGAVSERTAKRKVAEAKNKGIISVTPNSDKYCVP